MGSPAIRTALRACNCGWVPTVTSVEGNGHVGLGIGGVELLAPGPVFGRHRRGVLHQQVGAPGRRAGSTPPSLSRTRSDSKTARLLAPLGRVKTLRRAMLGYSNSTAM